ncbi:MAG: elongation factor 4 [Actinobacteria bacterium ATB1]|nr:elongation factor 4 [Actinobacteria bacterium ATB1]
MTQLETIRNFSIIAHIDHGKSTLADRFLQMSGAVPEREMREQFLDSMDLERERGITIKAQTVRIHHRGTDGTVYHLNLIDTPGHVDFGYEVSRSLYACEGALLLVDAAQGIEAQTLANALLAVEADLELVPVINKIDLPSAEPERVAEEVESLIGLPAEDCLMISAKTGEGVDELLAAIIERVPSPKGDVRAPLRALVFDSHYDQYRGVVTNVRIMDGTLGTGDSLVLMASKTEVSADEVGVYTPLPRSVATLGPGEVGYLVPGLKSVAEAKVGDTVTTRARGADEPLPGYKEPHPVVFCGMYPAEGQDYSELRDALERLHVNDASFTWEPETSGALGFGFRVGFLGLLHMEIIRERLEREYEVTIVATAPTVEYQVLTAGGDQLVIDNPSLLEPGFEEIREPYVEATFLLPAEYLGTVLELCQGRRGVQTKLDYVSEDRVELDYHMPLAEIITDFFDVLKSRTRGYASFDYEPLGYRPGDLARVDILLNGEPVDAFSSIVPKDRAYRYGRRMVEKLRELIPRQLFDVPIQAAQGGRIIARETVKARRKDVLAKCYGGDVTRKRKLLEKQKEGKKRMRSIGRVEVPQEAFISALRIDRD